MNSFKFCKQRGGLGAYAVVSVETIAGSAGFVEWAAAAELFEKFYGVAVRQGIRDALDWHEAGGGTGSAFRVLEIQEFLVDTKPDAVRCAATMAAWKALGHEEAQIVFEFDGEWKAGRSL